MDLTYLNSLVFKDPAHKINMLKPHEKNLELKVMVLEKVETVLIKNKQNTIHKFLISDNTGSIFLNLFDEKGIFFLFFFILSFSGELLSPGDIIYVNGAYSTLFKDQMILYEGFI